MKTVALRNVKNWLMVAFVFRSILAATTCAIAQPEPAEPRGVHLWDTGTPLSGQADLASRTAWHAIMPAASGHLRGDLVVETKGLIAAFASRPGEVLVCGSAPSPTGAAIRPAELAKKQAIIASTTMAELNDVVIVQAEFRADDQSLPITFTFRGGRIVAIRPEGRTRGISISAPIDLALVPSIVGDDLIYDPKDYPSAKTLSLPSEHVLLALLNGEGGMLVMTWQEAMPSVQLSLTTSAGKKSIAAVYLVGGKGVSLAILDAPGIWHREVLEPTYLERDVAMPWKPPFQAVWLTQLHEDEVKTTFEFQHEKQEHWRGGIGSYTMPVWFDGEKPMFSLGKQILPEGEAIIYFLERNWETPEQMDSPMDIVQHTLSADVRADVLSIEGRPSWWPMRPDAAIGGETCDVMNALQKVFAAGQEVEKQLFVRGGAEDMCFHLEVMFERNGRYYPFARHMIAYLDAQAKAKPELAPYLREMRRIAEQIISTYDNTRETLGSMEYAHELAAKTIALAAEKRSDNVQRLENLRQGWCGMGGAAEELSRREHTLARKLYQESAYRAAHNPEAVKIAEEIRRRTKRCLQRPDSYEMWENY